MSDWAGVFEPLDSMYYSAEENTLSDGPENAPKYAFQDPKMKTNFWVEELPTK